VSLASFLMLQLVVTSGAFVRLTGSGLGCENWPRCGTTPFPEKGYHAFIEFGNRVVALVGILLALTAWLAARRTVELPLFAQRLALLAFLGTVAQIPLGGITVLLDLHPLAVMAHFLLALAVTGCAAIVVMEAWSNANGRARSGAPGWLGVVAVVGVIACAVMIVTGAVATASGPHPGSDQEVERLGLGIRDTVYVHVRATAVYGIWLLLLAWQLMRGRRERPGVALLGGTLLGVLVVQMAVGEIQYRNALPWGLVLVHVTLAAAIWALTVAVSFAVFRPPLPLGTRTPVAEAGVAHPAPSK
jgi:cytochrome c oxidase assembly protein subunit 15